MAEVFMAAGEVFMAVGEATGKMTRGFAFVAYPAEYRSSSVMTFIVNQDGIVHEKDLGAQTADIAQRLSAYAPDRT
jgi:hypothetical protein